MKKTIALLYKNWHTDKKVEISYFQKFEDAEKEASRMIQQFKYWGGGCVPVAAIETIWTKSNGCRDIKRVEYPDSLYIRYARENGTAYGYYMNMHKEEKVIRIA